MLGTVRGVGLGLAIACGAAAPAWAHQCEGSNPQLEGLDAAAAAQVCAADAAHRPALARRDVLVVIDFRLRSGAPRLLVLNTETGAAERGHLTTHGRDSDPDNDGFAEVREGPCATAYGAYVTGAVLRETNGGAYVFLRGLTDATAAAVARGVRVAGRDYVPRREGRRVPGRSCGGFMVATSRIEGLDLHIAGGALLVALPPG